MLNVCVDEGASDVVDRVPEEFELLVPVGTSSEMEATRVAGVKDAQSPVEVEEEELTAVVDRGVLEEDVLLCEVVVLLPLEVPLVIEEVPVVVVLALEELWTRLW